MADSNTPVNSDVTKLISLSNLETYTGYIEKKSVPVTRIQYDALPSSKLTDGKSYYITDEGIIIKNGVSYGGSSSDTTYSLSAGTGDDANKIILTPSSGTPDKVTVPYATTAGDANTVNSHTVASDVPANAVFTDNNTTYGLSVGTGADANKIVLTPSTGNADKITVPYASDAGTVNGKTVAVNVPADAKFTDTTYTDATTSASGLMSSTDKTKLNGIASGAEVNVQADWNETSSSSDAYIQNKPSLGTAALRNIPTSGDASNSEVVLGADSRLSDARPASDVSSWAKASTKPTYTASEVGAIATTAKGANNGVAELDSTGKVPSSQLPSYVDDVLEYNSSSDFPLTGESGKIYIAKDTNKTYRWSGTTYTEISESLALGETSSTAYRGDRGKTAYDHASDANKLTTAQSSGLYKISTTSEGHIASVSAVQKSDITGLGIPEQDTNTTYGLSVGTGDDAQKVILTPSSGTAQKITVPYASDAGTVNGKTVEANVPSNAVFTDNDTTYTLSAGSGDDAQKIILTPSSGSAQKVTVPFATKASDTDTVKGNEVPVDFEGTQDEWDALTTAQKKTYDRVLITDDYDAPDHMNADEVDFSNTGTSLSSTDVQGALVEIANGLGTAASKDVATSGNASSTQVVMGNDSRLTDARNAADVYSWAKASSKPSYTASEVGAIATSVKGTANGVAELDANGLVPSSQLPSYVDDVLEYASKSSFPATGETGKIYVATDTNLTYRWSGSAYVEISPSLALGETSSTAFRGDRGKTAYDHATDSSRLTTAKTSGLYKIATTSEGHIASATAVEKSDITALGIPGSDTTYTAAANSGISLDDNNAFSNSGVRAVSVGSSAQGSVSVNTNGTSSDVSPKGIYFGVAGDKSSSIDTTIVYEDNEIVVNLDQSFSSFEYGDKLIVYFGGEEYVGKPTNNATVKICINSISGPYYFVVNRDGEYLYLTEKNKFRSGCTYVFTYVKTVYGNRLIVDDMHSEKVKFIGTTTEWNAYTANEKKNFDEVLLTDD